MTDETRRAQRKNIKDHSPPRKYTASPDMDRTIILVGVIFEDPSIDVLECRQLITAAKREGVVGGLPYQARPQQGTPDQTKHPNSEPKDRRNYLILLGEEEIHA